MTLRQRWMALWVRLGVPGDAGVVYDDLVARYSEPHRAYHTLEHIEHCLSEFEQVRQLIANPDAVELALWFHDAIYNTRTKDSEARSAELALKAMRSFSLPDRIGQLVASLIMATTHTAIPTDPDTQLFVDIDLSIFGQHEEWFDEYESRIREEYEWVDEDAFAAGRAVILRSFLEGTTIYSTQFFRDKYEAQARRNIARSLARLRS